jgi:hypothetical protein
LRVFYIYYVSASNDGFRGFFFVLGAYEYFQLVSLLMRIDDAFKSFAITTVRFFYALRINSGVAEELEGYTSN